ncbi:uncharacterized protein MELLADRAFT_109257 [Melampsora larici-populina 98AG31]|uniref:Natural resistance-associated macrophage protein n=1 Tax=Melampsora larici-populina (strain 98AG31 / pathotype 3-4-7) TaxID=747676 RepID=F4RVW4_MELLP|nr:uncharacterized protein MELLADRAFT_109257 [Melampsora larici-populina 98AG31]EGG03512.1 hypothetical protein MELLADRAFT_109257 [Melampsora larici-populina 98AG31]
MIMICRRHLKFIGPGLITCTNFLDPGNWATDLNAGQLNYKFQHLFIIFISILIAAFLQILSSRLGCITGKDLGQHCKEMCDLKTSRKVIWRWTFLYPTWLLAELSVLFSDIGELIGSAIAYNLIFPKLPTWSCVMLSFLDTILVLIFMRGEGTCKAMKFFEIGISILVFIIVISSLVLLVQVKPKWTLAFQGFIPSSNLFKSNSLYTTIAIIGATINPPSLFLGSHLATQERLAHCIAEEFELNQSNSTALSMSSHSLTKSSKIKTYLNHSSFDILASFLTLPLILNASILIISTTVNKGQLPNLITMYTILEVNQGKGLSLLYSISLLLSASAASLTATLAGQSISDGLMGYKPKALIRRILTRGLGSIPAFVVAYHSGLSGLNQLLINSQAAISLLIP